MIKNEKHALKAGKTKVSIANAMLMLFTTAIVLTSCSKNQDVATPQLLRNANELAISISDTGWQDVQGTTGSPEGKIIRVVDTIFVKNFRQSYTGGAGQPPAGNFYWSFQENVAGTDAEYDIHFTGTASADITADIEADDTLRYVSGTDFASVTAGSWATASTPDNNTLGMNDVTNPPGFPLPANAKGWYTYHWENHTVTPVAGRIILFRDGGGDLYKFQITSIYLDNIIPGSFPYFHFKYSKLN
jgi:hypothetical protein